MYRIECSVGVLDQVGGIGRQASSINNGEKKWMKTLMKTLEPGVYKQAGGLGCSSRNPHTPLFVGDPHGSSTRVLSLARLASPRKPTLLININHHSEDIFYPV